MGLKTIGSGDPSIRERKLIAGILEGKSTTAAAKDAGYGVHYADSQVRHTINKPRVQKALIAAMEEAGIDDHSLARLMKRGLSARKVIYHQGVLIAADPDFYARHQFLRTALEVRGDIGSSATKVGDGESWEEVIINIRQRKALSQNPPPGEV